MIYFHHDRDKNRIFVSTDGTKDDRFRFLPGSRWLPARCIWSLPGTPMVARRVVEAAGTDSTEPTKSFTRLLLRAKDIEEIAAVREAVDLSEPPISNHDKPQWLHQRRAYHFMMPLPATMLDMDMGTGKTRVFYDVIQNSPNIRTVLIACPKSGIEDAWADQFKKWWRADDGTQILALAEGSQLERANRAYDYLCSDEPGRRIIVVNYEVVWQPTFYDMAISVAWDFIGLDESHRIKAAGGTWSNNLFRLGERTQKRACLSGTPMANGPEDAYGQYRFLDAGIFGTSFSKFSDRYIEYGGFHGYQINGYRNQEEFSKKFYSIAFTVSDDVLDLPAWHNVFRKTKLEPAARKLYEELDKEFIIQTQGEEVTADNILVKVTRLAQIVSGKVRVDRKNRREKVFKEVSTAKKELFEEVLRDLPKKEPLVVFAQFHQDLDNIIEACSKLKKSVGELSGRQKGKKSGLKAWKAGETQVLAVQLQAGAESIELTRSRYCIFYSVGLKRYLYLQARKRVRRPGQKRPVTFIHLQVRNSVDIEAMAAIRKKTEIIDYIKELRRNK